MNVMEADVGHEEVDDGRNVELDMDMGVGTEVGLGKSVRDHIDQHMSQNAFVMWWMRKPHHVVVDGSHLCMIVMYELLVMVYCYNIVNVDLYLDRTYLQAYLDVDQHPHHHRHPHHHVVVNWLYLILVMMQVH